ncbi:MAG: hypothetical protein ACO3A2_05865 [Bdellovibrionia bacterium]
MHRSNSKCGSRLHSLRCTFWVLEVVSIRLGKASSRLGLAAFLGSPIQDSDFGI